MTEWTGHEPYPEGSEVTHDGNTYRVQKPEQDEPNKYLVRFYLGLWTVMKVLAVIGFIALIIWLRFNFDKWYINWILK